MEHDKSFFPRSASIKFSLRGTKKAEQQPEFSRLQEETTALIDTFKANLKAKIITATKIEIKVLLHKLQSDYVTSLHLCSKALLITANSDACPHRVLATILELFSDRFLSPVELTSDTFSAMYLQQHALQLTPQPYVAPDPPPTAPPAAAAAPPTDTPNSTQDDPPSAPATQADYDGSLFMPIIRQQAQVLRQLNPLAQPPAPAIRPAPPPPPPMPVPYSAITSTVKRSLESAFVTSWILYLDHTKQNATTLALKKLAIDHFDTKSTKESAMEIDEEVPANRELLSDLIQKEVTKRTSSLSTEIQCLRSKLADT